MADYRIRNSLDTNAPPGTAGTADRVLDANGNEFVKTSHLLTETVSLPRSVWTNTVGAVSNLLIGTTPGFVVASFNATSQRLATSFTIPAKYSEGADCTINVYQRLPSNVDSDTPVGWQIDYRVVTPDGGRLLSGTNTTITATNGTGASGTNGANTVVKVTLTVDEDDTVNPLTAGDLMILELSADSVPAACPRAQMAHVDFRYTKVRK
jgi:hypothetical protein